MIKFKAQGVSIDMLFCSLHYDALPETCNVHDEVRQVTSREASTTNPWS